MDGKKPIYRELQTNKKDLRVTSIVIILVSVIALAGAVVWITLTALNSTNVALIVISAVCGGLLGLLAMVGVAFGIYLTFIANAMINTKGSVKDGNRAIGTDNILKCEKCGAKLNADAEFCHKCGEMVNKGLKCNKCGAVNLPDAEFCEKCGTKFK